MVTTGGRSRNSNPVCGVPKPVLSSADRGVSTDVEGRAVPGESACGGKMHPSRSSVDRRVAEAGTGVG